MSIDRLIFVEEWGIVKQFNIDFEAFIFENKKVLALIFELESYIASIHHIALGIDQLLRQEKPVTWFIINFAYARDFTKVQVEILSPRGP